MVATLHSTKPETDHCPRCGKRLVDMTITDEMVERAATTIWAKRPDCAGKPWPLPDAYSKRVYKHNPIAAVDLCYVYARAALEAVLGRKDHPND